MVRFGNTSIKRVGNSSFFLIPSSLLKDKKFSFSEKEDAGTGYYAVDVFLIFVFGWALFPLMIFIRIINFLVNCGKLLAEMK